MGSNFYHWQQTYQATDRILVITTAFGLSMMVGYYATYWLPWSKKTNEIIRLLYTAGLLALILFTMLAPYIMDISLE